MPEARVKVPVASRVNWPFKVRSPFALNVPPVIATVPVAFTVISPVPLVKVPPLCTLKFAVLALAAPMTAKAEPVSVSAEPAPLIVMAPLFATAPGARKSDVPLTTPRSGH